MKHRADCPVERFRRTMLRLSWTLLICSALFAWGCVFRACEDGHMIPVHAATGSECLSIPVPAVAGAQKVCHAAYISFYDASAKVPRLVAYELTGKHTLGCVPRASGFHAEAGSATPAEYDGSGYDLGHMSPAQDNAWNDDVSHDSFSMVNVAPQLPGLNREEWERLEEDVRAWAWDRGDLLVYVGTVLSERPHKIADVDIPYRFFKIVVDRKSGEVLAFEMPQAEIDKGDVQPWMVTVASIEDETGLKFHLGKSATAPWPADLAGWHKAHKEACGK